jgi:hypothetical protein
MGTLYRGLIIIIFIGIIGWYLWLRDWEQEDIQDIYKDVVGSKPGYQIEKDEREFKEWWDSLSDEEKAEVVKTIHNPLGDEDEHLM